ncbi:hypothetical protein [Roseivivax sp. CAU 1761]
MCPGYKAKTHNGNYVVICRLPQGLRRYVEALDHLRRINTRLAARNRTEAEIEVMLAEARTFDAA